MKVKAKDKSSRTIVIKLTEKEAYALLSDSVDAGCNATVPRIDELAARLRDLLV